MVLTKQQLLHLAAESMVDPRTITKIYAGETVRGEFVRARVQTAAQKLEYESPPAVAKKAKARR